MRTKTAAALARGKTKATPVAEDPQDAVKFTATAEEIRSIMKVAKRAGQHPDRIVTDLLTLQMDLEAVHSNDIPLDFEKLLKFDDFSFWHDVGAIQRLINRNTGKLRDRYFLPRCARPSGKGAV